MGPYFLSFYQVNMKKVLPKKTIKILESLLSEDQDNLKKYRAGLISGQELEKANNRRVDILKNLINKHGFPTITTSSRKAYKTAVVITLHSGNIPLLNKSINVLTQASQNEVDKGDIAFMIDKKLVIKKRPQLYGTQFKRMKNSTVEFLKIEDQKNLNRRRKALGMSSFERYKKLVTKIKRGNR